MSAIDFTDNTTVVPAAWLDDVDAAIYEQTGVGKTTVASATTPDIFAVTTGRLIDYTGTATCTGFVAAVSAGSHRTLYCAGAAVFTADANLLIDGVASGSNLTCVAGDILDVVAITTTQWKITARTRTTQGYTLATEQASTSGASIDFTGIPSWATKIYVMFSGVSTNGTSAVIIQIGDAGGFETTGYLSGGSTFAGSVSTSGYTTGFGIESSAITSAAHTRCGMALLTLENAASFRWIHTSNMAMGNVSTTTHGAGVKATSAALTQVRITTVNGTDTFDAGAINIAYE